MTTLSNISPSSVSKNHSCSNRKLSSFSLLIVFLIFLICITTLPSVAHGKSIRRKRLKVEQMGSAKIVSQAKRASTGNDDSVLNSDSNPADNPQYISGGSLVENNDYAHAVAIVFRANRRQYCSGTLLNSTLVLTAAHCLFTGSQLDNPDWSGIVAGYKSISENGRVNRPLIGITSVWVHPDYVPNDITKNDNDIALLHLSTPVAETPAVILRSQTLYTPYEAAGQKIWVAGWGSTPTSTSSDYLLKTDITLYNPSDCQRLLAAGGYSTADMICGTGSNIKDACQGDSGAGAGVYTNEGFVPLGIVSFGRGECGSTSLGAYTRVSAYLPFITAVRYGYLEPSTVGSGAASLTLSVAGCLASVIAIITFTI